ncbi:unnamed protein product [Prorocentrum cordatum]|uniref:Polysaccharide pyruvyl transferase domain-containing protein n=1 Tax=Prorocentrum cordatum TaxID=2364126 RepID=A0ABN9SLP2_9DINO|nr:unnamed protein product [Polarella glacialis]
MVERILFPVVPLWLLFIAVVVSFACSSRDGSIRAYIFADSIRVSRTIAHPFSSMQSEGVPGAGCTGPRESALHGASQYNSSGCTEVIPHGRKVLLYGAMGRHNFGDMLMPWIVETMLQRRYGFCPDDFLHADVAGADLRAYGGHLVIGVGSLFSNMYNGSLDVIFCGGETLQDISLNIAMGMFGRGFKACNADDFMHRGHSLAYLLPKDKFAKPGLFIANTVGGPGTSRINQSWFDHCTLRQNLHRAGYEDCLAAPDSVIMINILFGESISLRTNGLPMGRYFAWQFNSRVHFDDGFVDAILAAARTNNFSIVMFRAGAAPGHDGLKPYEAMKSRLEKTDSSIAVTVFDGLNIWDISALISRATLLISTSLHCRIIAFSFYVPRVTVVLGPNGTQVGGNKHFAFMRDWDGDWDYSNDAADARIGLSIQEALRPSSKVVFDNNTRRGVGIYENVFKTWADSLHKHWKSHGRSGRQ